MTALLFISLALTGASLGVCYRLLQMQHALADDLKLLRVQVGGVASAVSRLASQVGPQPVPQPTAQPEEQPEILQHTNLSAVSRTAKVREWLASLEQAAAQETVNAE